jgi:hypothetical protein
MEPGQAQHFPGICKGQIWTCIARINSKEIRLSLLCIEQNCQLTSFHLVHFEKRRRGTGHLTLVEGCAGLTRAVPRPGAQALQGNATAACAGRRHRL